MSQQYTLIDLLYIVRKNLKTFLVVFLISATISVVISLLLPKWYKASARLLPPKPDSELFGLGSLENMVPFAGLNLFGQDDEILQLLAILQSRTMLNQIINEYDLQNRYNVENIEEAREALLDNCEFEIEENGTLLISVYDKKPEIAASMANRFAALLDSLNIHFKTRKARQNRIFIENRLRKAEQILAEAEKRFKEFQETYGAIALPEQTKAAIEAAATLQAEIYAVEVELSVKEHSLSPKHYTVVQLRRQLEGLKKKLEELIGGKLAANGRNTSPVENLFIPFDELPELGLKYARLFREVEAQAKIYEFLYKQYEQAKIREAHDTPTLQILDPAVPPLRKARPKRSIIVLISVFVTMLFTFLFFLIKDMLLSLKEESPQRFQKASYVFGRFLRQ
ncbi:MAG: GNVR domain-containing protein [candidate division KSB1 bacterium]|nr:GNVR domain-containing protein [candidate division KSB1 bacterium]